MLDDPTTTPRRAPDAQHEATSARAVADSPAASVGVDVAVADPVVLRDDPLAVRAARAWRRAGRAEGQRREWHPWRAVAMVAAILALALFLPGALVFLAMLSFLVLIHEGGHLVAARRTGMRPTEFFVGFGPTIWSRTTDGGLRYGIKALPAGGYVKIPGMGPREQVEAAVEPHTYRAASRPRRLVVILAGVTVNFVFAVIMFASYSMLSAPAPEAGSGVADAVGDGVSMTSEVATSTLRALGGLVVGADDYAGSVARGEVPEHRMMSPIGGAQVTGGIIESDPAKLLLLTGVFSASLGLLNLLPLLPLDGGHAMLVLAEAITAKLRRRPHLRLDPNRLTPVAVVVLALLLGLSASAAYLDVLHPVAG